MDTLDRLLRQSQHHILFTCIAGSRAYGTSTSESDEDLRGVFALSAQRYLSLDAPPPQLADERGNTVYFSLRRLIELLADANPNVLELLFMPLDCVRKTTPEMEELIKARSLFITRQCGDTHIGYAMSQIRKARGQNKWVNDPKPPKPPLKEHFCFVIPRAGLEPSERMPCRPIALLQAGWNLDEYHVARLEHAPNVFRLYHYGANARGVFRGDVLVCESIPEADEPTHFAGLLLFNHQAWRQALTDHQNYWTWRRERNESRWRQQESGELDFDAKNLMHTVRLLMSGRSILSQRVPMIRFTGADLSLLLDIRAGKLTYEQIMDIANSILSECESLKAKVDLPQKCDRFAANDLLRKITEQWECRTRQ